MSKKEENFKLLLRLLDKAEFKFSASEAILFSKCLDFFKSEFEVKVIENKTGIKDKNGKSK